MTGTCPAISCVSPVVEFDQVRHERGREGALHKRLLVYTFVLMWVELQAGPCAAWIWHAVRV
jgi:hypothetical protein